MTSMSQIRFSSEVNNLALEPSLITISIGKLPSGDVGLSSCPFCLKTGTKYRRLGLGFRPVVPEGVGGRGAWEGVNLAGDGGRIVSRRSSMPRVLMVQVEKERLRLSRPDG